MNSVEIAQRSNTRFFFVSLVLALGMAAASGFFVTKMFAVDTGGVDASTKACLAVMRTNGFNPTVGDGELSISMAGQMNNLEGLVYKSGVIIASCPAYTLKDYCAGAACQKPGLSFTLKKKEL
jgi:hypothetical protein